MGGGLSVKESVDVPDFKLFLLSQQSQHNSINLTASDMRLIKKTWQVIRDAQDTDSFIEMCENPKFEHETSQAWFLEVYFDTFLHHYPEGAATFVRIGRQMRRDMINKVLSSCLELPGDQVRY